MSVEWGFESPIWMSKAIVQSAHPILLKKAVIDVIDHLSKASETGSSPFEIIDRLVQVSTTGKYEAPEQRGGAASSKVIHVGPEGLTPEQEKEIQDFISALDGIPTAEKIDDDDESYDDFLKRLGIPDEEDFREDEDEDDDPQPA